MRRHLLLAAAAVGLAGCDREPEPAASEARSSHAPSHAYTIETVADQQLVAFAKVKRPGEIIKTGLWKYSRHPNYFGELTFWWGLYLFGLAADPSHLWTVAGPIAMTVMFFGISIPWMDRRSCERRPEYAEHMKRVSGLVPWFPRAS